jgi:starch-binding outer membrane protein, SusD/RagB family
VAAFDRNHWQPFVGISGRVCAGLSTNTGCNEFLEEIPKSTITVSSYYNTEKDAESAVVYAYADLTRIYQYEFLLFGDIASDNFTLTNSGLGNANSVLFGLFSWQANTLVIRQMWSNLFTSIGNVNIGLEMLPKIKGNKEFIEQRMGELYFLRALHYFNLVRIYGDVPILEKQLTLSDDLYVARNSASEVYSFIINDLYQSIKQLPGSPLAPGRASTYVAKTLLAKVYLTRANSSFGANDDFKKVVDLCEDIEKNSGYKLEKDYRDIFKQKNELKSTENIFEVQYADNVSSLPSSNINVLLLSRDFHTPQSFTQAQPSHDLRRNIESGDRRSLLVASDTTINGFRMQADIYDPTNRMWLLKYQDTEAYGLDLYQGSNFYVFRFADVLLMLSEAENEISGPTPKAISALNAVRNRAGLNNLLPSMVSGKEVFRDAILKERRIEFAGEGHRWFDLVRTKRLVQTMKNLGVIIDEKRNIYPIPLMEIEQNPNMVQTPGY